MKKILIILMICSALSLLGDNNSIASKTDHDLLEKSPAIININHPSLLSTISGSDINRFENKSISLSEPMIQLLFGIFLFGFAKIIRQEKQPNTNVHIAKRNINDFSLNPFPSRLK